VTARGLGFRVAPFGVSVGIVADSTLTAEALERYVLPCCPRTALDASGGDHRVEVRRTADDGGLEILVDGDLASTAPDALAAVAHVQHAIDEAVVSGQTGLVVVHGGVVAHRGRVVLLPGSTQAGKSALVAELVRQGAVYFSDEYAFIDDAGRVHPYPRTLLLRDASGAISPRLAAELDVSIGREPMMPGLVIAVRYRPGADLELERASQADGMLLLLRNTPQALADQPWILRPLERAVAGAA
jgi:hypothetical protein